VETQPSTGIPKPLFLGSLVSQFRETEKSGKQRPLPIARLTFHQSNTLRPHVKPDYSSCLCASSVPNVKFRYSQGSAQAIGIMKICIIFVKENTDKKIDDNE
jgi:hypothetical protein